ncbi:uncharacterized protein LOC117557980 [Scomber scombrus]|uniref:Uncharacterized protein LOC117557980 n=1 Tax=Scomber scombrus TaxID=13677 RepID=A0AAV1Q7F7_SCOSC
MYSTKKIQKATNTNNPPEENQLDKDAEAARIQSDILKDLKETEQLKERLMKVTESTTEIRTKMDAEELRNAENVRYENRAMEAANHCLSRRKQLEERCERLETFARRNNLRIRWVPQGSEGNDIVGFVKKLIKEELGVQDEILIERAQRANGQRTEDNNPPRSIVVCVQNYHMKQTVLQAARAKKDIQVNNHRIYFDVDFTTKVYKERAKYRKVRKQLEKRQIKSYILFPAKLKIFASDGKFKVFDDLKAAAEGLREYGINMEIPSEETYCCCSLNWDKVM